jgi:hypothetical protein
MIYGWLAARSIWTVFIPWISKQLNQGLLSDTPTLCSGSPQSQALHAMRYIALLFLVFTNSALAQVDLVKVDKSERKQQQGMSS